MQGSRLAQESFQWLKEAKFTKNAWQIERADAIKPVADELDCSMAQLAIAWCLKNKDVSTVVCAALLFTFSTDLPQLLPLHFQTAA